MAQDLEPEYIAVSDDSKWAYATLQENNALAKIDIDNAKVLELIPLGYKDHSLFGNLLDASDKDDTINLAAYPGLLGMYQPDAIASFTAKGKTYLITANEGDARDYDTYAEEARIKDLNLDTTAFPNAGELRQDEWLGRLTVTTANGDPDGDGDFDHLYSFGGRSFSVWGDQGNLIYDSGDDLEQLTALPQAQNFNADQDENDPDKRSDNKGPEPEGIVLGKIGEKIYAFVGLERIGGIMVFDISEPAQPAFVQYINPRDFSINPETAIGIGPEGLDFVPQGLSPNGKPLVIAANEVSGDITVFEAIGVHVMPLTVSAVCDEEQAKAQQWNLNNPNTFPIRVAYEVMTNNQEQTGWVLAEPGDNMISTPHQAKATEITVRYLNENGREISLATDNSDCLAAREPLAFSFNRHTRWLLFWKVKNTEKEDIWFKYQVKETGERFTFPFLMFSPTIQVLNEVIWPPECFEKTYSEFY